MPSRFLIPRIPKSTVERKEVRHLQHQVCDRGALKSKGLEGDWRD